MSKLLLAAIPALCAFATSAHADEYLWVYTRGADTLPKGALEAKFRDVSRFGKHSGEYAFHDLRPALEYGVTDRLSVEFEGVIFSHDYAVDDPDLQPLFDSQDGAGGSFSDTQLAGYEIKAKFNVLSAYKHFMGLAVGFAYERREKYRIDGADIDQDSFVPSVYLQKNFLDDTLVFAVTTKMELERRKSPGILEEEISFDVATGIAYRFTPKWYVGMEFRHQSDYLSPQENGMFEPALEPSSFDFTDFRLGTQFQNGNYLGPSLHYAEQKWWVTGGLLCQIAGGGEEAAGAFVRSGRNWDEHERIHISFAIGYEF